MAYCDQVKMYCKNNLCRKPVLVSRINGNLAKGARVCPHCGFKTLDWIPLWIDDIPIAKMPQIADLHKTS